MVYVPCSMGIGREEVVCEDVQVFVMKIVYIA